MSAMTNATTNAAINATTRRSDGKNGRAPSASRFALLGLGLGIAGLSACMDSRGGKVVVDDDARDGSVSGPPGRDASQPEDLKAVDQAGPSDGSSPPTDMAIDASATNNDPFDITSCMGFPMTTSEALARIGTMPRIKLADATLMRRSRTCTGATKDTCGPWGTPVAHTQRLLTYSGGVTTDYKTFSFPTHLILFVQSGQPKAVIRHESDYRHDVMANTRGVVFSFGVTPMEKPYPQINVWDFAPAPYRYDDLLAQLGSIARMVLTTNCARIVVEDGIDTEIAALYRF